MVYNNSTIMLKKNKKSLAKSKKKPQKRPGFTIVELLVVIVIISILFSFGVAAFTSAQQRARNNTRIANATALLRLLNIYVDQQGKYPYAGNACLGKGYTDWDSDGTLDCYIKNNYTMHPQAALDSELQKIAHIPRIDASDIPVKDAGGADFTLRGYGYFPNQTIDGQTGRAVMTYDLLGNSQKCGMPILSYSGGVYTTSSADSTYQYFYSNATRCEVAINEP